MDLKKKRIFFLGAHQLLVQTELLRLRLLGYEVFNPPYLSLTFDQSMVLDWQKPEDSTLPQEIFYKLSRTNFFYDPISEEIGEILNTFFSYVIVTLHPLWLKNILSVYHGPVIYRVYGSHEHPVHLTALLTQYNVMGLISERENFWFCPHNEKALLFEDSWLTERMRIVPYCITNDVIDLQDTWHFNQSLDEMGLMCPRIADIQYYKQYYQQIEQFFNEEHYKVFGKQLTPVNDARIVGNLDRALLLKKLVQLRGFTYHYRDKTVCYLFPIEFMTLGGPVVYLKGSLLSRYFADKAPGRAKDLLELRRLSDQIQRGDRALIDEIIESQKDVRKLYHPEYVWPIFDETFTRWLSFQETNEAPNFIRTSLNNNSEPISMGKLDQGAILFLFHIFGAGISYRHQSYYCSEGIARLMRAIVRILLESGYHVVVTSWPGDVANVYGFFSEGVKKSGKLQIQIVNKENSQRWSRLKHKIIYYFPVVSNILQDLRSNVDYSITIRSRLYLYMRKINVSTIFSFSFLVLGLRKLIKWSIIFTIRPVLLLYKRLRDRLNTIYGFFPVIDHLFFLDYIRVINQDPTIKCVVIPHYFIFPEVLRLKKTKILNLPDYLPHFYPGMREMGDYWLWRIVGRLIAKQANIVLTTSECSRTYLPKTALKIKKDKIVCCCLPMLNIETKFNGKHIDLLDQLPMYFVFYPTRDRTSKRLIDFARTITLVNDRLRTQRRSECVYGVLTTPTDRFNVICPDNLIALPVLADHELAMVFKRSLALLFTSENEGNFPTQIHEALRYKVPVIATKIPVVTDELGQYAQMLKLVSVGDCQQFASAVLEILDHRNAVLSQQKEVKEFIEKRFSYANLKKALLPVFNSIIKPREGNHEISAN
jgi:glycosyltransferase involved in cell wall biosynthesis